jgi:hypothetical protein
MDLRGSDNDNETNPGIKCNASMISHLEIFLGIDFMNNVIILGSNP